MREVLYRAISMAKGEHWLYGQPRHYARNPHTEKWTIYDPSTGIETDIDEETLGQYTGITDVDGDKIYEGDILSVLVFQPKGEYLPREVVIEWNKERASYIGVDIDDSEEWWGVNWLKKPIIIGNRWDNPELLKGGEK